MMIRVGDAGSAGIIRDVGGHRLDPGPWTDGRNIRFKDEAVEKSRGHVGVLTGFTNTPYGIFPSINALQQYWILTGLATIEVNNGTSYFDLTRTSGAYNATVDGKWTGGVLSGILVLNNPADTPQFWAGSVGTPFADLVNWTYPAISTMRAKVVRPFLNQLIAGNVTKDSINFPTMFKFSSVADPGTLPATWDPADPTELTGEQDLAETSGHIVDMEPMGRAMMVYKEDAVVAATFVGGTFVYDFEWISRSFGIFSQNCIAKLATQTRHIALGYDDVALIEGRNVTSVIDGKNRRWLFNLIDKDNQYNSFVVANDKEKEVWICFPESGSTWCTLALIYNWADGTWGVRELPELAQISNGVFKPTISSSVIDSFTTTLVDDYQEVVDTRAVDPTQRALLGVSPTEFDVYQFDKGERFGLTDFISRIERSGLGYNLTRTGQLIRDHEQTKLVKRLIPHITGNGMIDIYVGGQDTVGGAIKWQGPFAYEIGVTKDIEPWVSSVLPAFRFESNGNQTWRMTGFDFEQELVGKHWD